jgi:hypothetical protein
MPSVDVWKPFGMPVGVEVFGTFGHREVWSRTYNPIAHYQINASAYFVGHYGIAVRMPENVLKREAFRFEEFELGSYGDPSDIMAKVKLSGIWHSKGKDVFLYRLSTGFSKPLGENTINGDFVPLAYLGSLENSWASLQSGLEMDMGLDGKTTLSPYLSFGYYMKPHSSYLRPGGASGDRLKGFGINIRGGYSHSFGAPKTELMPSMPFISIETVFGI